MRGGVLAATPLYGRRRMYKNHKIAFLIEIIVGLLCIVTISLIGAKGLILLAIIPIRSIILEKGIVTPESVNKFYSIGKISVVVTSLTLLTYYLSSEFLFNIDTNWKTVAILIFPYFLLTHGIAGMLYGSYKT